MSEFIITPADRDRSCITWLKSKFPFLPNSLIQKIFRKKDIKINGNRVEPTYKLQEGDSVKIYQVMTNVELLPDDDLSERYCQEIECMKIKELDGLMFLNKPYGLSMHAGTKVRTSFDLMLQSYNRYNNKDYKIVHRLDKSTTGIFLVADGANNARAIGDMISNRSCSKSYIGIVLGFNGEKSGIITKDVENKAAITEYELISIGNNSIVGDCAIVLFRLISGRKHQIRIHSKEISSGICGDTKYLESCFNVKMMLHAFYIKFDWNNKTIDCRADMPIHMRELVQKSNWSQPKMIFDLFPGII